MTSPVVGFTPAAPVTGLGLHLRIPIDRMNHPDLNNPIQDINHNQPQATAQQQSQTAHQKRLKEKLEKFNKLNNFGVSGQDNTIPMYVYIIST